MSEPIYLCPVDLQNLRCQVPRVIGRISQRIHYALLSARGYHAEEIAALYDVDSRTVRDWHDRFREGGLGALDDLPRSGRPRLASLAA